MRVIVIYTDDTGRLAKSVIDGLQAQGHSVDSAAVGSPLDLPAAVLRASKGVFDAAVAIGNVERASETYIGQNIHNSAISVSLPVIHALNAAASDVAGIIDRIKRVGAVGTSSSADAGRAVGRTDSTGFGSSAPTGSWGSGAAATAVAMYGGAAASPARPGVAASGSSTGPSPAGSPITRVRVGGGGGGGGVAAASTGAATGGRRPYAFGSPTEAMGNPFGGSRGAAGIENADPGTMKLLGTLREALIRYGGRGIATVARRFAISDRDGSRTVDPEEFGIGLRQIGLSIPEEDIRRLFSYFDHDASGSVDYDEFLVGLRGELNERRRAITELAFRQFDQAGRGFVTVDDLISRYDASQHPDVKSGRRRPEEIIREFLDGFDGGVQDGNVTLKEFLRYYAAVSAYIDEDDYYELMMRNVWHISGGEGWCANTSNRRVLVTRRDGTQSVEEVPNDLAAGKNVTLIKRQLQQRGIDAVEVSLYGDAGSSSSIFGSPGGSGGGGSGAGVSGGAGATLSSSFDAARLRVAGSASLRPGATATSSPSPAVPSAPAGGDDYRPGRRLAPQNAGRSNITLG